MNFISFLINILCKIKGNSEIIMLNDYYQNIGMKGFIQRYGFINAVKRGTFMFNKLHFVKDYEVRKILWQKRASLKIKQYLKFKDMDVQGLTYPENNVKNPIWIYWNKGIEDAPLIVQKCYESVCRHSNQTIVLLSDLNLADYIHLPEYIEKKKATGQIPMAGYADLVRFALLEHYGGTWIDSTVFLTEPIPKEISNSDFFAVRNSLLLVENPVLYPAWLLHAKKENKTIREIRNVAFAYWLKNEHVIEYLLPNLIITLVVQSNPEVEQAIPYMNSDYSEYLVKVLAENYSEEKWNWIKKLTGIHKLTYKLENEIDKNSTFYRHIIEEE